ncbi:hypothetical protein CAI16_10095 [Virgibacillus dokdonensis]|uniref:Uncharacterized protein n=1 Tax=Virgibacillus dokdonensis TaxID=302167 RepID=A0A3E0WRX5_9BACI|nr:hypothetical protein [Virgibacillus dokdonensis]RFA34943.1 hypothetical protein CAI16_10095 [Virgibacillus dokdonensis]
MKKYLRFILFITIFLLGIDVIGGANSVDAYSISKGDRVEILNYIKSPENYIEYLEKYDEDEALRLGIEENYADEAVSGAKTTLEEFKKLSDKDQQLYLKYISNPENLIKDTIEGNDSNLEIVEEEDFSDNHPQNGLLASYRTVKHTGSLKALGITWTKYAIEGKYEYNRSRVTKKLMHNAWVSWNVNPTVTNSRIRNTGYISGGKYYGEGKWKYKIGVIGTGFGAQIGTVDIRVKGNRSGKMSGSFWTNPGG